MPRLAAEGAALAALGSSVIQVFALGVISRRLYLIALNCWIFLAPLPEAGEILLLRICGLV